MSFMRGQRNQKSQLKKIEFLTNLQLESTQLKGLKNTQFPNNVLNKIYRRKIPLAAALSPTPILDADCHSNYSQTIQEAVFVSVLTQKWNVKGTAID